MASSTRSTCAVSVATTTASAPQIATCGMPAAIDPQTMAAKNNAPLSGLSWNITCPMPRRLLSMKRRADDDAQSDSQPDRYFFTGNLQRRS